MEIKKLFSEEQIIARAKELANLINTDFEGQEVILVTVLSGAVFFATELSKHITLDTTMDFIKVSSYEGEHSTGIINFKLGLKSDVTDKNVIIIEDIVDTGRTLSYLKSYLKDKNPRSVKICTMLDKKERREYDLTPDYCAFEIPDKFVIGYGLDYDEKYRNLPYVGYIEQ